MAQRFGSAVRSRMLWTDGTAIWLCGKIPPIALPHCTRPIYSLLSSPSSFVHCVFSNTFLSVVTGTMSKKGKTIAYTGYAKVVPSNRRATNRSNHSGHSHTSMTRTACNENNFKVSNRYTGTHTSGNCLTMSKNGKMTVYTGYAKVVPSNGWATNQSNQYGNSHTSMTKTTYNDNNYKVSNRYTETHNSGNYMTRSGSVGYKQEAKTASTVKVTDKVQGFTTEHQIQVNVKKVVYPTPGKSSSYKNINYY
ncbi:hypothetical protein K1719_003066 [Acacia pycnantha]|nr:hypothetical protein K1719_003066 [Acacia pycnantha]